LAVEFDLDSIVETETGELGVVSGIIDRKNSPETDAELEEGDFTAYNDVSWAENACTTLAADSSSTGIRPPVYVPVSNSFQMEHLSFHRSNQASYRITSYVAGRAPLDNQRMTTPRICLLTKQESKRDSAQKPIKSNLKDSRNEGGPQEARPSHTHMEVEEDFVKSSPSKRSCQSSTCFDTWRPSGKSQTLGIGQNRYEPQLNSPVVPDSHPVTSQGSIDLDLSQLPVVRVEKSVDLETQMQEKFLKDTWEEPLSQISHMPSESVQPREDYFHSASQQGHRFSLPAQYRLTRTKSTLTQKKNVQQDQSDGLLSEISRQSPLNLISSSAMRNMNSLPRVSREFADGQKFWIG
jgi:hypothetical protein